MQRPTLRQRLNKLFLQWLVLFVLIWGGITAVAVALLRREAVADRLVLARVVARHVETTLTGALRVLERTAAELGPLDASAAPRLRAVRFRSPFRHALWLLDGEGRLLAADPESAPPPGLPRGEHELATGLLRAPGGQPLVVVLESFRRGGRSYLLAAALDPRDSLLDLEVRDLGLRPGGRLLLVDRGGWVIAAAEPRELLRRTGDRRLTEALAHRREVAVRGSPCLSCDDASHTAQLSVLVPLRLAPWGVLLQETGGSAWRLPPALQAGLLVAALLLAGTGGLLVRGVSRSLVEPIGLLAGDARQLRDGDLVSPIAVEGDRELEELAAALDAARQRLAGTLAELAALNRGLEEQVAARTRDLNEQLAQRRELVRRLLRASEEERRRIGRELHDEISQLLTVVQLSLGRLADDPGELAATLRHLSAAQRELHRVIHDLRPSVLDDLGLASALEWYATHGLQRAGLQVSLEIDELPEVPGEVEITIFRIYQEIVTNILKHARAERVAIELYVRRDAPGGARLVLAVEDDGVGFAGEPGGGGMGLVGMRERAALVGGTLRVDSEPGMGTRVVLEVPLPP
jgi:signal transduction histidine kinase